MMNKTKDILGVALVKEACPLCAKEEDGPIIMNTRLTKYHADKVKELHGKTTGYMEKPCKSCQEIMNKAILLIGIVDAKTDDKKNPYRSGNQWGVTEDFVRKTFQPPELAEDVIRKRTCFFPVEVAHKMGFPDCNIDA